MDPRPPDAGPDTQDPVVVALERRAQSLSYALQPQAIARKLREELVATVGPQHAAAYFISASTDDGRNIQFEISRLGPRFAAKLSGNLQGATLRLSWEGTTGSGWRVSVGAQATVPFERPDGAEVTGSFSVLISR